MNIPTQLTVMRLLAVPALIITYYVFDSPIVATSIFVLAAITDWLDGYAARQSNQETPLGAFLDPIADKLLVVTTLTLLMSDHRSLWLTLPAIVIISREILISALREWLAKTADGQSLKVTFIAKAKTACQMLALTLLLFADSLGLLWQFGIILLCISAMLSLLSLIKYIKNTWSVLTFSVKQQ